MRKKPTPAEYLIWGKLRKRKILNLYFQRQKNIYRYILDFYCHKAKLAIELDGAQHNLLENIEYDKLRDETLLQCYGIKTLRFSNKEVFENLKKVIEKIYTEALKRID